MRLSEFECKGTTKKRELQILRLSKLLNIKNGLLRKLEQKHKKEGGRRIFHGDICKCQKKIVTL